MRWMLPHVTDGSLLLLTTSTFLVAKVANSIPNLLPPIKNICPLRDFVAMSGILQSEAAVRLRFKGVGLV